MQGSFVYLVPVTGISGTPENPIVLPPGIWPPPSGNPLPPVSIGGGPVYPPGIWPSPKPPEVGGGPIPPLPGVWPPPGQPTLPIVIPPPVHVELPIYIEGTPEHPLPQPPGTIWPPLPSNELPPSGKVAVLIWVVGVGYRWYIYDASLQPTPK